MNGFFRRFFLGDFGPPPPPDLSHQPTIPGQTVVEILYHDSKCTRAVITCDPSGTYRIHKQFWDTSDWKAGYGAFWYSVGNRSFTDSIEIARTIARDELNCLGQTYQ